MDDTLVFFVNGKKVIEPSPDPVCNLLHYLRKTLHLTGSKESCGEGGCGSCTVILSNYDHVRKEIRHLAVVACLVPLCSVHGCAVTTVEGLGTARTGLHPIQRRLVESHGIQCGYCSPGMVMSMAALLRNNPTPTQQQVEQALQGNLCRCTGYRPILEAFSSYCKQERTCALGEHCCQVTVVQHDMNHMQPATNTAYVPYDPTQSCIFPSELQLDLSYNQDQLQFTRGTVTWIRPTSLQQLLKIRQQYPESLLIAGSTMAAFQIRNSDNDRLVLISAMKIQDMLVTEQMDKGLKLGANLTITDALKAVTLHAKQVEELDKTCPAPVFAEYKARSLIMVKDLWEKIGSEQLRNMVTIGGSVAASNYNSDVVIPLLGAGAHITIASSGGIIHTMRMDQDFVSGTLNKPGDVILSIFIPFSTKVVYGFKQSWRQAVDRAIVNASLNIRLDVTANKVILAILSFGGVGDRPLIATETGTCMRNRQWTDDLVMEVCKSLTKELGSGEMLNHWQYRQTLALSFFFKFSLLVDQHLSVGDKPEITLPNEVFRCGHEVSKGTQVWEEVPPDQPLEDPVGRPVSHRFGEKLSTGEALFYSDMPAREDELFLALVRSSKAHANILSINYLPALEMAGVVGYVDHKDIPCCENMGSNYQEEVFATCKVFYVGQVICGILGVCEQVARAAAQKVIITYEELPAIFTIDEAVASGSFFKIANLSATKGNIDIGMEESDEVIEGIMCIGCQDHFYMETQCSIVVPTGEEYHVYSGTQDISNAQYLFAKTLGIPFNKVIVHQKRLGGGFGGKEGRPSLRLVLLPAAVAAYKFGNSVRCILTRREDITTTGTRHPFLIKYKAGYTMDGHITALDMVLYANAGATLDYSERVALRTIHNVDGAYNIPHVRATANLAKTNIPPPTTMRGVGVPQAVLTCEEIVDRIAQRLCIKPEEVRELNLHQDGDYHLAGQALVNCSLERCWQQLKDNSSITEWRKDVEQFNRKNHWKKRGLAAVMTKHGIGPGLSHWYQAGALVNVYKDGSVLLIHSGVEMGQGLNTKMIQIASRVLGIHQDKIHINETSTETVPNTLPTFGSMGTDWNGPAVIEACTKILERMKPIKEANPEGKWEEWVTDAYQQRISLSATGFNSFPNADVADYDRVTKTGCFFHYFTYGAACSEVEIDCLTGEHVIRRTDIVMDVGKSINPAIDVGQIEGAFIQGQGLYTIEEIKYDEYGVMLTQGPDSYKIPTVADIPVSLNISILKGASNPKAVYSSKAIGEPPYALATSVFFAIKNAIRASREDAGLSGDFCLDSPATAERIRMACVDKMAKLASGGKEAVPDWRD